MSSHWAIVPMDRLTVSCTRQRSRAGFGNETMGDTNSSPVGDLSALAAADDEVGLFSRPFRSVWCRLQIELATHCPERWPNPRLLRSFFKSKVAAPRSESHDTRLGNARKIAESSSPLLLRSTDVVMFRTDSQRDIPTRCSRRRDLAVR